MNVRAHMSMIFHLDKCIGCHTCSVACKNLWTDRKGAEYMWWNNVETRPGTGYPTQWEDQEYFKGGWEKKGKGLKLKLHSRLQGLANLFFNHKLPDLKDYYEPFTFRYQDLFNSPEGKDQPTAIPISMINGKPIDIDGGPNWDDDLGGSGIYANNDLNMADVPEETRQQMQELERLVFNYLPRICNHCLNPSCVAACPSGAIYKRAEDGVVLVNENECKAWRMCVAACPYKKVYYNWNTGKSEKCILCFPRMETGQAPACAHSCVGRIRYMGVLLYDADQIPDAANVADEDLVEAHRAIILDPFDPEVIAGAKANGIDDGWITSAQQSPAYKFVKEWKLALPLHPEFRTMVMMYYIPPLSPVVSVTENGLYQLDIEENNHDFEIFKRLDAARLPVKYLANLFSAGNETVMREILKKLLAVRVYMRRKTVVGKVDEVALNALDEAGLSEHQAIAIYKLTTLPTIEERFVFPPYHREMDIEASMDPLAHKGEVGLGFIQPPKRSS
ncbi:MAG: nitrate reductase subunit beta [Chloroflexi bacterium]|jgi:nitrate reductase / nitrite oxidoreductase, beta subunit|nr:nitrate reductase subunit beta [Chloroflexota bacterium]MBT3670331.1 nitrate reductase subunit beta [Chloroflexota bacterium]MBT4002605.1 nitrate reductase subunit beta [Chloroflexota bacterium]MBT4305519.1 nitrate reductase subunit beta [Chloroflexota bacterium]MBT4533130.1 nitrate reductase subunit beta [Chloroflexota bacterium]